MICHLNVVDNRRLHVYFNLLGWNANFRDSFSKKSKIQSLINKIWAQFGIVTDVHYHTEFRYCTVMFETPDQGKIALLALQDDNRMRFIIDTISSSAGCESQQLLESLFAISRKQNCLFLYDNLNVC